MNDFKDRQDREFKPSSILLGDDEITQNIIDEAANIASKYPDMSPKHVYGLALEYALGLDADDRPDNFRDYVMTRYEQ